jgi:hypothetical protein
MFWPEEVRMPAKRGAIPPLGDIRVTRSQQTFRRLIARYPKRLNVVSEGDSWLGYPSRSLLASESNLVDVISRFRRMNFLRLEANGDEAVEMLAGRQRKKLCSVLARFPVDLLLFSGGGNDIVGRWDIEPLLKPKRPGMSALDCIHEKRLSRKLQQLRLAYEELIDCRDLYRPECTILTHAYDYPIPRDEGARILGRVWAGPWLHPYLHDKGITLATDQRTIARSLIRHPSRAGFRRIAAKFRPAIERLARAKRRAEHRRGSGS